MKQIFFTFFKKIGNTNKYLFAGLIVLMIVVASIVSIVWANSAATVTDNFSDSTKIATSSNVTVSNGVTLSAASTWTCGSTLTDPRDGKTYTTSLIGSQCWMSQNLNVGVFEASCTTSAENDGALGSCASLGGSLTTQIGYTGTTCGPASGAGAIQKYYYANMDSNGNSYGGLYTWNQMMCGATTPGVQGICPVGWHLPTHDEFTLLERTTCTSGTCATDFPYDTNITGYRGTNEGTTLKNASGLFKGLLAGGRDTDGSFYNVGSHVSFWSSLPSGGSAWSRNLDSGNAGVNRGAYPVALGFSVRCLKN